MGAGGRLRQAAGSRHQAGRSRQPASAFLDDTPTSKLIRQILGAVSEFDKAMVVAKLKGARERKRVTTGRLNIQHNSLASFAAREIASTIR